MRDDLTDAVMDAAQIARAFGVSVISVREWIARGMPARDDGMFVLSDCIAWVRAGTR